MTPHSILIPWIESRVGIQVTESNIESIRQALRTESIRLNISIEDYIARLTGNQLDPAPFIHLITVHESYFLRSRIQMNYVVNQLIPAYIRQHPGSLFRILSIACAQGEEPYSLAMLALDAGWNENQVLIQGIDISHTCIMKAQQGFYSSHALRGVDPLFIQRHFQTHLNDRFEVLSRPRSLVRLNRLQFPRESINLLTAGYQVIFCQNMLFYLNPPEISAALLEIKRLLDPNGWLFVDGASGFFPKTFFKHIQTGEVHGFRHRRPFEAPQPKPEKIGSNILKPKINPAELQKQQFSEAERAYRLKNFRRADQLFDQIILDYPNYLAKALVGKARILADEGIEMEAMELAENALLAFENGVSKLSKKEQAKATAIIAVTLHKKGLHDAAEKWFTRLKKLDTDHPLHRLWEYKF
ncbi:CheR family methyltransferase [Magnetococcales bacterium HHB-1]